MKIKSSTTKTISLALSAALLITGLVRPTYAQQPRPIVITLGQPNIWSLEQAHYLLARMHRQNLDLQTAALANLDPNATNASRIDILKTLLQVGVKFDEAVGLNNELLKRDKTFNVDRRQDLLNSKSSLQTESTQLARDIAALKIAKAGSTSDAEKDQIQAQIDAKTEEKAAVDNQLTQTNSELQGLTSTTGEFQKAEPNDSFNSAHLTGDLDDIIKKVQLVNPSIAATLRLDNHIQMQYEIIAKQLTLLRDEVGPGERLVFLELPQSINATQDKAENKMAQVWWRIAGYTTVDSSLLKQKAIEDLLIEINKIKAKIAGLEGLKTDNTATRQKLVEELATLCAKKEKYEDELRRNRSKLADTPVQKTELCKSLEHDIAGLEDSIKQIDKAIAAKRAAIQQVDDQETTLQSERTKLAQALTSLSTKFEKLRLDQLRDTIRDQQNLADGLLQGGSASTRDIVRRAKTSVIKANASAAKLMKDDTKEETKEETTDGKKDPTQFLDLENDPSNRSVRTIDIIPRQNAINVNDTKQTVAKTGIFAAVSFLFGFGGKFTYERQREHAEQFLNQELFTSGFGKGEKDFGWNFYPFAGSKQLASGVRTTFAVAIIPKDAESLLLKARGCYFPRKENQPLNYAATASWNTDDELKIKRCNEEQAFVLPVPGGSGDGADYYVTGLRYTPHLEPGDRMIATITGQNLPSQIGVMINGIPLREAVGLAQLNVESILGNDKTSDNCVSDICGRFERINAEEVVMSFKTPSSDTGTPRITLIGPGRSVELNNLFLRINGQDDVQLNNCDRMFGPAPDTTLRTIADFKVAPAQGSTTDTTGVLTGKKFKPNDDIYVNGSAATKGSACRDDLCIVKFPKQSTDFLTVTISPKDAKEKAVSKTFANPTNVSIVSASVISYIEEQPQLNVLTVRLDGSGFRETLTIEIQKSDGSTPSPTRIVPSAGQMFLKIPSPEPIVQINIKDPANNKVVSAVVVRPDLPTKEKK